MHSSQRTRPELFVATSDGPILSPKSMPSPGLSPSLLDPFKFPSPNAARFFGGLHVSPTGAFSYFPPNSPDLVSPGFGNSISPLGHHQLLGEYGGGQW